MMPDTLKRFPLLLFIFFFFALFDFGFVTDDAEARSRSGGRSFSSSRSYSQPPVQSPTKPYNNPTGGGGFMRGLAGGLVGGAVGSLLFGSLAGAGMGGGIGGSGIGLFQILLFGGIAFFIYRRFFNRPKAPAYSSSYQQPEPGIFGGNMNSPPPPPFGGTGSLDEGIAMIRRSEPGFDPNYFKEVAQDVFFQVQAGWMRRDIDSYRHLLGQNLAREYEGHFAEMRANGHINKLENIAVRKVEVVDAGVDGNEEFATVLFTANLLDYTVDEKSGAIVKGSNTEPVKFAEKWTWARPVGTETWKLEGIDTVQG